jgi:hypothetical protein
MFEFKVCLIAGLSTCSSQAACCSQRHEEMSFCPLRGKAEIECQRSCENLQAVYVNLHYVTKSCCKNVLKIVMSLPRLWIALLVSFFFFFCTFTAHLFIFCSVH